MEGLNMIQINSHFWAIKSEIIGLEVYPTGAFVRLRGNETMQQLGDDWGVNPKDCAETFARILNTTT